MNEWKEVFDLLLNNTTFTIKELKRETQKNVKQEHVIDVILYCFCLLRDNYLCLKSRLKVLLILEALSQANRNLSVYLHEMIGDIYDGSSNGVERTVCSWILIGTLENHEGLLVDSIIESIPRMNPNDDREYKHQTASKHPVFFYSNAFPPSYLFEREYPTEDVEFTKSYLNEIETILNSFPSFSRPEISFTPTRDEFLFPSPISLSPSFIYAPLQRNSSKVITRLLSQSFNQSLTEEEMQAIRKDIKCYKIHLQGIVDSNSGLHVNKLRTLIANNPVIALDLIHCALSSNKTSILDALLQIPISLSLLHVVSQLVPVISIPNSFLTTFVERSVKAILVMKEETSQMHLIQCFCFFLAGLYKNKRVEESVLRSAVNKLKTGFISIPEVACVVSLMN